MILIVIQVQLTNIERADFRPCLGAILTMKLYGKTADIIILMMMMMMMMMMMIQLLLLLLRYYAFRY